MLQPPNTVDAVTYGPPSDPIAPLRAALRGHYEIEREIGQGAFATVYLARDLKHERKVALKVLNSDPTSDTGELRFIREIRLLARLQHPNILPLHDSGHVEALLYYVMPYVGGETLRDRIDREKQLPVEAACNIAREVAEALGYAHGQGIIHRDIKPENILLSAGHPVLADFGIARIIDVAGVLQLTKTGMGSPGTPAYMSPEQLMGDKVLDGRSDTYSLGCVLFEMLTGKPPFAGKEGFVRRFTEPPPHASSFRKNLPSSFDAIVCRALARAPGDRYQTAEEFVADLSHSGRAHSEESFSRTSGPGVAAVSSDVAVEHPAASRPSFRALVGSRTGVGLIATLVLFASLFAVRARSGSLGTLFAGSARLDSTRFVIPQLRGSAASGAAASTALREGLSDWTGLTVVPASDFVSSNGGDTNSPRSTKDVLALAKDQRARYLIWGDVSGSGDSTRVRIELYDVRADQTTPRLATVVAPLNRPDAFAPALMSVLKDTLRPAAADGGDRGTRSFPAWLAYGRGHMKLARWNLDSAELEFARAVKEDPSYSAAHVWLAQLMAWRRPADTLAWESSADRALAGAGALSDRDRLIASGLAALARKQYPAACESYQRLSGIDPQSFVAWYGLGECQRLDNAVVADLSSPSGWRFRASFDGAGKSYARALRLEARAHTLLPFSSLQRVLPFSATATRRGEGPGSPTKYFAAYPSLAADTLAFVPYPLDRFAALPPEALSTFNAALSHNIRLLLPVAAERARLFPADIPAQEALADVLEARGDLTASSPGSSSAIEVVRQARQTAKDPADRLSLAAREVRLRFKQSDFRGARILADSVLDESSRNRELVPEELIPVAALAGKIERTAEFSRTLANDAQSRILTSPSADFPARLISPPLADLRARMFASAALGACTSLPDLERRFEQQLLTDVPDQQQIEVRAQLKSKSLSLAGPCTEGRSTLGIPSPTDQLYILQQSFARNQFARVRAGFATLAKNRRAMRPGDISLDYTFQEAWLRAAIGDTVGAIRQLDLALTSLPTMSAAMLRDAAASAAAGRAMALRADLAVATHDEVAAKRWSHAVAELWASADPPLQPLVTRMKRTAQQGH